MADEHMHVGVGKRLLAQLFDLIVILVIFWFIGSLIAIAYGKGGFGGFQMTGTPAMISNVTTVVLVLLYFIVLEARNGQTLGKKIMGIRVVSKDGSPVGLGTSAVRNVLRLIDAIAFYLVGALFIWTSSKKQRLGDMVAGTVVIKA